MGIVKIQPTDSIRYQPIYFNHALQFQSRYNFAFN